MSLPYTASSGHALIFWPHSTGSKPIPANFSRDDDYADDYFQGATSGGGTGGGSHTHSQSHTHTGSAHNHSSCSLGTGSCQSLSTAQQDFFGVTVSAGGSHTHSGVSSTSIAITYTLNSDNLSSETGADPSYAEVIAVKPTETGHGIPQYGVVLSDTPTIPEGFAVCDGGGATVDLDGRFLRGASAASDPGSPGGSSTHDHGSNLSHTHDDNTHNHPTFRGGTDSTSFKLLAGAQFTALQRRHHDISLGADLDNVSTDNASIEAISNEPAYTELLALQRESSGERMDFIIVGWTGTQATLASDFPDWQVCDGTGGTLDLTTTQVKCTSDMGSIGGTGGANSHVHELGSHTHTHTSSHDHAAPGVGSEDYTSGGSLGGSSTCSVNIKHTANHAVSTSARTPTIFAKTAWNSGSTDKRRPYRDVVWIKYQGPSSLTLKGSLNLKGSTNLGGST